jgi:sugar phosphate isomerase/epimerase
MKIAFNTYSLRKEWQTLTSNLTNFDPIVKFVKMMEGVDEVELLDRSFKSDPKLLKTIQEVFDSNGIKIFSLGPHECPLVGASKRAEIIKKFKKWIDMAADRDIHNFRVSLGGGKKYDPKKKILGFIPSGQLKPSDNTQAVEWTLEVLKPVVQYAEERDVTLCIETHHQYSSNPDYQEKLLDALPSKFLGFIYDIGNYESRILAEQSLDVLIAKKAIKYWHAKTYTFDENGFAFDKSGKNVLKYLEAVKLCKDAGIEVNLSIEWEGKMPTTHGIFHTYELCRYSIAKAEGKDYKMKLDFEDNETLIQSLMS